MSLRIRWQIDEDEGAFPLHGRPLHLVFFDGALDRANALHEDQDGISFEPPDDEGKMAVQAFGELEFVAQGKRFQKVRLPIGGAVGFACGEWEGKIAAEGKAPVSDPLVGTELGGHRILGRLGAGAVGVVYRALQINLDREIALKMLAPEVAKRPEAVQSFRNEARAAGRLTHPHVVQVYDVGEEDGRHYYTMEMVSGGDLEERLAEGGPMPWEEAVAAIRDCCRALAYAEEHGLVHRDVKPENLMRAAGGIVKLADLGLAATRGMLDTEAAGGTPHFMAPEAIGKQAHVDHRSDLYSVGCSLYRLLTKETVFQGSSVRDILRAHRDEEPPSLREAGVDAPRELDDLLAALLAKDPDERPQHASEVIEELDALLEPRGGKKGLLIAIPVLAAAGVGLWAAFGPKEKEAEPEKIIEYVENPDGVDQATLDAERAKAAFYQAQAQPEADGQRRAALVSYLQEFPNSEFAAQAQDSIDALDAAAQAAAQAEAEANQRTPEELEAERKLTALRASIESAIAEHRFAQARLEARTGELATDPTVISLAETVDAQALAQFAEWEKQHASALQAMDWQTAADVRGEFRAALQPEAPLSWTERADALDTSSAKAQDAAADARFAEQRVAFLAQLQEPVRTPLRNMDWPKASEAWAAALAGCEHEELAALAAQDSKLLEAAGRAFEQLQAAVQADEQSIEEYQEGRKATVLGISPQGLRLRVQISGERIERVDAWEHYLSPEALSQLLADLSPEQASPADQTALHHLIALDSVATRFTALAQQPSAAAAGELADWIERWDASRPDASTLDDRARFAFEDVKALCRALEAGDDYAALARLEDFGSRYSLLSAWTSNGGTTWGLRP